MSQKLFTFPKERQKGDKSEYKFNNETASFEFKDYKQDIKFIYTSALNNKFIVLVTQKGDVFCNGTVGPTDFMGFTKIGNVPNVKFVNCGESFIIVIDEYNNIFGYGEDFGQFGNKCVVNQKKGFRPIEITEFKKVMSLQNENIKFITCNLDCVIIVTKDNKILIGGNSEAINGTRQPIVVKTSKRQQLLTLKI